MDLLVPRAEACLAARDVAGYRALFAEAAAVEDQHRRHQARRGLIEAGLAAGGRELNAMGLVFAAIARETLDVLDADPREPVLLNYAGIALYELGELGAAEQLFLAARRLDPSLPHLEGNLEGIARRRREGLASVNLPAALRVVVGQLAPRAKRVAARAHPATGLRISLCMIAKDEESMLGRTLDAVAPFVDEVVLVDTGSSDRTVEIAEAHGARVLHHAWTGDFSAARNVSLDAATGDWILYLDADEVLGDGDGERLRALAGHTWREAFYLVMTNYVGDEEDRHGNVFNALRLFRNRPEYRFSGRIHEQWAGALPGFLPERITVSDVRVEHYGYLGVVRDAKGKGTRNLELLHRQQAEGDDSPFLHFNIGSELAAAGDNAGALAELRVAWENLTTHGDVTRAGFAPLLANRYVRALRACGELEELRTVAADALERYPGFTDVVLEQAFAARQEGDVARAEALLHRCLELGDAPSRYSGSVGGGTYLALLELADLLRSTGRLEEAEEHVRRCLTEHPRFIGVVEPYAAIRLARGADPADVVAEVHAAVPHLALGARFILGVALHEAGAAAQAEAEFHAVVAAQPGSGPARLALAESLLSQGRLDGAVEAVAAIEPDSPWAPAAARTVAFATLAAGDAAGARAALDDPAIEGVHPAERELLGAWQAALAGAEPPASLPREAAGSALVMLEALARLEAFDAFELLAARYETVDVPWRERREGLAALYLRRGFLASAADEWIAVCEAEGADASALIGLAQVAWARGLDDDAVVFAQEARELEPGHAGAARLLEHLGAAA
ncbi:MAG TPA: glycosyltransferase [Solirubrobacteraceae bacterium]|nr:glycosyltransferase [Solirubrobacteraceae bacterium]